MTDWVAQFRCRLPLLGMIMVFFAFWSGLALVNAETAVEKQVSLELSTPFYPNFRVSDIAKRSFWAHTFSSGAHGISLNGKNVYVTWYDVRNGDSDAFVARSKDGGLTFEPSIRVNDDPPGAKQYKPSIGVDESGVVYLIWRDDREGNADIFFAKSTDQGRSFSKNRRINDDKEWIYQGNPSLGVSPDGTVYASWSDNRNGQDDIYFTVSRNKGRTFRRNIRLNDDKGRSVQSHPTVGAGKGGLVVVAWEDFRNGYSQIYYARSTDSGMKFDANRRVTPGSEGVVQISPSVTVGKQGRVAITWAEFKPKAIHLDPPDAARGETLWWEKVRQTDPDIYVALSTDEGASFSRPLRVNDDTQHAPQAFPSVVMDGNGQIYVTWEDFRNGHADIYYANLQGGKVSLAPNVKVNDDAVGALQTHPSMAVSENGKTFFLWTDGRDNAFGSHDEEDEQGNDVYFTSQR